MKHSSFSSERTRAYAATHARLGHETPLLWETGYRDIHVTRRQWRAQSSTRAELVQVHDTHHVFVRK